MQGFGAEIYGQATFGKGVQKGWVGITQPISTYANVGEADWNAWVDVQSNSTFGVFGGLTKGMYGLASPESKMITSGIKMTYDSAQFFGVGTSTFMAFGHIAWDGQIVDDTTWTIQEVE